MAATVANIKTLLGGAASENLTECQLSALTAGITETIAHNGPTGVSPHSVTMLVLTPPSDGSLITMAWTNRTSATTSCSLKFQSNGGSLDGAVVVVQFRFLPSASGGLSTITTT